MRIETPTMRDLDEIVALEAICYEPSRRSSHWTWKNSLESKSQACRIIRHEGAIVSAMVAWHFKKTTRVYNVCTHPAMAGRGFGRAMMAEVEKIARDLGHKMLVLESQTEPKLVAWYEQLGYKKAIKKIDFYGPNLHAWRMAKPL